MARPRTATTWWRRPAKARCAACAWRWRRVKAPIDYINPHATSTPVGDIKEIEAIREVFGSGDKCPPISATKSLTGHSLGADRRAGGDLFAADDAERLHLRKRPYRGARPGFRRHADRARAPRQCQVRLRCCRIPSASAAPMPRSSSSTSTPEHAADPAMNVTSGLMHGQARPGHGRRQRSFDRLGHRQDAGRRTAPSSPSPIRARRSASGSRRWPTSSARGLVSALRCRGPASVDAVFAELARQWGALDFLVHCHRLFRQERAEGPLRRHDARQFHAHHGDLLLLLHRARASARPR